MSLDSAVHYVDMVHTCYIPVRPRSIDGAFDQVFVRVSNYGPGSPAQFVTDPTSDSPLDRSKYEDWVLDNVEGQALQSVRALATRIRPHLTQTVFNNAGEA